MKWSDITIEQFNNIERIFKENGDKSTKPLIEYFFNIEDANKIPIIEFNKYLSELSFLNDTIEKEKTISKKYIINNKKYELKWDLMEFTTAQYIDFMNYVSDGKGFEYTLSTLFIPKGKKYNEGYNMEETINDIKTLSITTAYSIYNYFFQLFPRFIKTFHYYLMKDMKKAKKMAKKMENKEVAEKIMKMIEQLEKMI